MSGGNKKKVTKAQGWEEAGSEFYQESYPTTDGDLEILHKDPHHLTTLLPSKQSRSVATIRMRTHDTRTSRRQTSSRSRRESTVHRRASTTHEVQVSMLPDLSENISTEETAWEEIMQIKSMPIPMSQKMELKSKILNQPNLRLQGYEQFKWKRRKVLDRFQSSFSGVYDKLELWKGDLKRIEGHFGTGVVAYFLFIRWLLFLNVAIFCLIFIFVLLPFILSSPSDYNIKNCGNSSSIKEDILNFIQGTGFMECTLLFYGFYNSSGFNYGPNDSFYYDLSAAYIVITLVYFLFSLICVVKAGARGFRERLVENEGQFYLYCNLVFGGWDFCIHNEKSANIKHKALYHEIKGCLEAERSEEERQNRTRNEKTKLYIIRTAVNFVVLGILGGCAYAIYYVFNYSTKKIDTIDQSDIFNPEQLLYEFLPSLTMVCLNIVIPFIFQYLIGFEHYSQVYIVRLTLVRTIFLRFASLIVFYATLYSKLISKDEKPTDCWETYVGQQIYKLYLTDFASGFLITFFVNFPRALLAKHFSNKVLALIGEQSFDLPKQVLDVVYTQTLCWLGCFYTPLLSAMAVISSILTFYIKKFTCMKNCKPSAIIYRASRSKSMFMLVLLVSYIFALLPIVFSISEIMPSTSCGPFNGLPSVWQKITNIFHDTPYWFQSVISFLSTAGFAIPVLIVLVLLLYYFTAVNSANRHLVLVLKNQLVLEGHDKQFLLDRLSLFLKQQQEQQKRSRRNEMSSEMTRSSNEHSHNE